MTDLNRLRLVAFATWSCFNIFGMLLGAFAYRIHGDGLGLMIWCAVWELYVVHKIFEILEDK